MSDEKKIFCPQCKEWYSLSHFECLPLDLRCNKCIPADVAGVLYDQKREKASKVVAGILEEAEIGKNLKPLARLIDGFYDAYGGCNAVCEDAAGWVKDLAAAGKKGMALSFLAKIFSVHAKVERTQVDEDWNNLSKAEIKSRLLTRISAIIAESEMPDTKKQAIKKLLGGESLD